MVAHKILETAKGSNSPFPFWILVLDFGLGLGLGLVNSRCVPICRLLEIKMVLENKKYCGTARQNLNSIIFCPLKISEEYKEGSLT